MDAFVSGIVAALLTLFDLDRTFYIPSKVQRKVTLYAWYIGFIFGNGVLAFGLAIVVATTEPFHSWHPFVRGFVIGLSYLALIRVKFTTFNYGGEEVPFGLEAFYEGAKGFAYKRINLIAKAARFEETTELASKLTLADLGSRSKLNVDQDALLRPEEKRETKAWILRVLQDQDSTDMDKRLTLANFLLSGQRAT